MNKSIRFVIKRTLLNSIDLTRNHRYKMKNKQETKEEKDSKFTRKRKNENVSKIPEKRDENLLFKETRNC